MRNWINEHHRSGPGVDLTNQLALGANELQSYNILRPARVLYPGENASFYAVTAKQSRWSIVDTAQFDQLSWYLLRLADTPEEYRLADMGNGPVGEIEIPDHIPKYRVLLKAEREGEPPIIIAKHLRTPFPER